MRVFISRDWGCDLKENIIHNLPKHNIKFSKQYLRYHKIECSLYYSYLYQINKIM